MTVVHLYKPQSAAFAVSCILLTGMLLLPFWFAALALPLVFITVFLLHRSQSLEQSFTLQRKERLLIIAPHQDDCVISAAGLALQTLQKGGTVKVVYLSQEAGQQAIIRQKECEKSWHLAGVSSNQLLQLNLLPELFEHNSQKINHAASVLQTVVDDYQPSTIVFPLFEGGHKHHDIAHHIVTNMLVIPPSVVLLEAPMYNLYYSINHTPNKWLKLLVRCCSLGMVKYFNPKEGIDGRPVLTLHMTERETTTKSQMLKAFKSQGGESLAKAFGHADRFYRYQPVPFRAQAYAYRHNLAFYIEQVYNLLPQHFSKMLFGGKYCCFGCRSGITDLTAELKQDTIIVPGHFIPANAEAVAV